MQETSQQVGTSIAVVVQESGPESWLLWNTLGVMAVAGSHAELGRWVLASLADVKVPRVDRAARPGGGQVVRGIAQLLDKIAPELPDELEERTAVHVVVYLDALGDEDKAHVVVWAPKGPPRTARGAEALGKLLAALEADKGQPRVPPGAPPDPAGALVGRGFELAGQLAQDFARDFSEGDTPGR